MTRQKTLAPLALSLSLALLATAPAFAAQKTTSCEMDFNLKGWSVFYKVAHGAGTITCDNGQRAKVTIEAKGGGLTAGKSEIRDGRGKFSEVADIDELFGSYANAGAAAGAGKSAEAQVITKGEVSLALSGKGTGIELGVSFGKFTMSKK
jgi:hypothetical protein